MKGTTDNAGNSTNFSVGVDIEDVERFRKQGIEKLRSAKIFTKKEIEECRKKKDIYESLAARFAGKEAVIKAVSGLNKRVFFRDIEILGQENNGPRASVKKNKLKGYDIKISLAHTRDKAIAFAIIVSLQT